MFTARGCRFCANLQTNKRKSSGASQAAAAAAAAAGGSAGSILPAPAPGPATKKKRRKPVPHCDGHCWIRSGSGTSKVTVGSAASVQVTYYRCHMEHGTADACSGTKKTIRGTNAIVVTRLHDHAMCMDIQRVAAGVGTAEVSRVVGAAAAGTSTMGGGIAISIVVIC